MMQHVYKCTRFLKPTQACSESGSLSVQPFLPNTQDHAACVICNSRPHLYCTQVKQFNHNNVNVTANNDQPMGEVNFG